MYRNQLDQETSPYLLQHRDNPVHWQSWSVEAFAIAQSQGKPILLSVGYAACHWCHVMAHECFENEEIAHLMNALFVNIKVDREERPDVDAIYQNALALMGEQGGWPLTMFLGPDGRPFWGGTYFPPEPRWGRPGFPQILRRISEVYETDPESVGKNQDAILDALQRLQESDTDQSIAIDGSVLDQVAQQLSKAADKHYGGIGGAPKFPQAYALTLLWRAHLRSGNADFANDVILSLKQMCQGGIYDHLGGGFARYSTDAQWLVPHFEKMLYDNAQLLQLLTLVWQKTGDDLFRARIADTVAWLLREMVADGGAFAATLDADSEGEEGKFYLWQAAEIDALLPAADSAAFKKAYDVRPEGNWEGKTILNRSSDLNWQGDTVEAALQASRQILLEARGKRIRPGWDDKVLADWNGLMIAALAEAAAVFAQPTWMATARQAFDFITSHMQADGRLLHSHRQGRAQVPGMLDDYANMAQAALSLYEHCGEARYLTQAKTWVDCLDRHFWDQDQGGYYFTADDAENLITRMRHCHDNAIPAGNGTMLGVLTRLWLITGEDKYQKRSAALYTGFAGQAQKNFFPMATFLNNVEYLLATTQIIILAEDQDPAAQAMRQAVLALSLPNRLLLTVAPAQTLPENHPAFGKTQIDGQATAYVCMGQRCSLPLASAEALTALLTGKD